jgi:hypothetical protein
MVKIPKNWITNLYTLRWSKPDLGTYVVMDEHDELVVLLKSITKSLPDGLWTMHFDGARSRFTTGVGLFSHPPQAVHVPFSFRWEFDCTNFMIEYEALLLGIEQGQKMDIKLMKIRGDYLACGQLGKGLM